MMPLKRRYSNTLILNAVGRFIVVSSLFAASFFLSTTSHAENLPKQGHWRVDKGRLEIHADPWGPSCGAKPTGHSWRVSPDEFQLSLIAHEILLKSKRRQIDSRRCERPRGARKLKLKVQSHEKKEGLRSSRCQSPKQNGQIEISLRQDLRLLDPEHMLLRSEGYWYKLPPHKPEEALIVNDAEQVWYSDGKSWKRGSREQAEKAQRCIVHFVREEKLEFFVEQQGQCSRAGPAKKVSLQPQTTDLAAGAKLCFKVQAVDVEGCPTTSPNLHFSLQPAGLASVDDHACVQINAKIEKPAALALQAKSLGFVANALIRVTPKEIATGKEQQTEAMPDLKTLVQQSGNAKLRQAAKSLVGDIRVGEVALRQASAPLQHHSKSKIVIDSKTYIFAFVAMIAGLVVLIVLLLRGRKKALHNAQEAEDKALVKYQEAKAEKKKMGPIAPMATRVELPQQGTGLVCPKCHFEFEEGTFCPFDQTKLEPLEREARHTLFIPISGGMVCPVCKTHYPSKARFCGIDRSPLIPASLLLAKDESEDDSDDKS